jgi:hypothetical protein
MKTKTLTLSLLLGLSRLPAVASPLTFTFSGNVDGTTYGLSVSTPLVIQWTYDPSQAPYPGSNALYLMNFSLNVGGFAVLGKGTLDVVIQPTYDQFELGAAGYVQVGPSYQEGFTGLINGKDVWNASLNVLNNVPPLNMLSSTSLPISPAFISKANLIQLQIESFNQTGNILVQFSPGNYALTVSDAVPEPATGTLAMIALAALTIYAWGSMKRKSRVSGLAVPSMAGRSMSATRSR